MKNRNLNMCTCYYLLCLLQLKYREDFESLQSYSVAFIAMVEYPLVEWDWLITILK